MNNYELSKNPNPKHIMNLSQKQLNEIIVAHAINVVNGMDMDDLVSYARDQMVEYYEMNDAQTLFSDLMNDNNYDIDAVVNFMVKNGVNEQEAHQAIVEFMENN